MNKKIVILPLLATLMFLNGCNKSSNANKKGDVVNDLVLKANTKENRKNIFSNFSLNEVSLSNSKKITYENGFFVITNDDDQFVFYSTLTDQIVFGPTSSSNYQTFSSNVAGGYLRVTEDNLTSVIDGYGNTLVDKTQRTYSSFTVESGLNDSGIFYCDVKFDSSSQYFHYSNNGSVTIHATNNGDDYNSGSTIQGLDYVLLDDYGHEGYLRIKNSSRYIIFDNNGNEISSFTVPDADAYFFVGDYLIYQNSLKLDDNNNNYDYVSNSGERYSLETYRINYLTAKKETLSLNYLLSTGSNDINPFFDEKGVYSYSYANLRTISDKKILSSTLETYIIDSAGVLHDNVTGINLGAFERIGNYYYNTDSKTIYDGNLNEISILTNMSPYRCTNADMIICAVEGKYGAVNEKGQVVIPFEYETIYSNYVSGSQALALKDGILCKIDFSTSNASSNISVTYNEYISASYFGCGIFKINSASLTEPSYLSLTGGEPEQIHLESTTTLSTYTTSGFATDSAKFVVLESISNVLSSYRSSSISVSH